MIVTAMVYLPGKTGENMKENTKTEEITVMDIISLQTAKCTKVTGKMGGSMERVNTQKMA